MPPFQMQSLEFYDFFSLLKGILLNNTNPFVLIPISVAALPRQHHQSRRECVSRGASLLLLRVSGVCFSTETELRVNTNFLFQSKCLWVPRHLLFSGNVNFILVPELTKKMKEIIWRTTFTSCDKKKWFVDTAKMFRKARHLLDKWKFHKLNNGHRYTREDAWPQRRGERGAEMAAFGIKLSVLWCFSVKTVKWKQREVWSLPPPHP